MMTTELLCKKLNGKTLLITGATGLIGKAVARAVLAHSTAKIIALVRSESRARGIFAEADNARLRYIECDVAELKPVDSGVDYIIHGASNTQSGAFVNSPVEVIKTAVDGTTAVLEFAKVNAVSSVVFLSTMEVYGAPIDGLPVFESSPCWLDPAKARSSYPESKRLCESLCAAYAAEYGVHAKTVRLTQTFGEGVDYADKRLFAELARCAIEGKNIELATGGETERSYLYIDDAVSAILTVLLDGADGEAYNAANPDTYCSVYDMAQTVARDIAGGKIKVITNVGGGDARGFAPPLKMNLNVQKLIGLGWSPRVGLNEAFVRLIADMKAQTEN